MRAKLELPSMEIPDLQDIPEQVQGMPRRDFLRLCGIVAAATGVALNPFAARLARALETNPAKPKVVWLEGLDCAGCTVSFGGLLDPPTVGILLDRISLRYHETLMFGTGKVAEKARMDAIAEGGHVLVVEGSVPTADDRFCTVGGVPFKKMLLESAEKAAAIVAVGACASFGGITRATPARGRGVAEILGRPVVNLSTCPVHPEHLVGTLLHILGQGTLPELDAHGRPKAFFGVTVHDHCPRRPAFDKNLFLMDWNDPAQRDYCLMSKGCKGPWAWSDCAVRYWNHGASMCTACGAGCQACSEPGFYEDHSPLFFPHDPVSHAGGRGGHHD